MRRINPCRFRDDLERWDARSQFFFRRISYYNNGSTIWPGMTKFGRITHGGVFIGVSHAAIARGWVSALPNFGGSLLFMHTPFDAERP